MTKVNVQPRTVYVVECPSCRNPVDFTGEGGVYFKSKREAAENADLWIGTAGDTLTEICGCKSMTRTSERRSAKKGRA